ncbi:MAG: DUF1275 family protein [Oscillospiraceae bacterium]|nr:DUF1275 family protein [Oscillospiraceae bacterium]
MSDTFLTAALVALSGGAQDSYTYFGRGKVFANAQTGNVVLFSSNLMSGNVALALSYLIPILSFLLGVFTAEHIRHKCRDRAKLHWRQLVIALEIILLFAVGFMPQGWNGAASALVSFVCAMQVQSFRKVCGNAYASTMCIGNMRSGMDALYAYFAEKDPLQLMKAFIYLGVIALFGLGAGLGYLLTAWLGNKAIWSSCLLLLGAFFAMQSASQTKRPGQSIIQFGQPSERKTLHHNNHPLRRSINMSTKTYQNEIEQYVSLNELTTGGGLVLFGGSMDRSIPVGELKQSFSLNMPVYNRSLSALSVKDAVDAYDGCVAELNPESVLLHIGAGDRELFMNNSVDFDSSYRALIDHIRAYTPDCRIAVVSVDNAAQDALIEDMNRHLKNLAEAEHCEFCEINGLVWNPRGTQELMGFMYDLGFVRPLKIKRPLYDLAKIFFASIRRPVEIGEPKQHKIA